LPEISWGKTQATLKMASAKAVLFILILNKVSITNRSRTSHLYKEDIGKMCSIISERLLFEER